MHSNRTPLYIIGSIILIGIIGVIAYSLSQNSAAPGTNMSHEASKNTTNNSSADAVQTDMVEITDFLYSPEVITVKVGTKVTWTNKDAANHTVTTEGEAPAMIDSGLFGKDESFSFTFDKPGTYQYFCEPHPYMKGTVIVTE